MTRTLKLTALFAAAIALSGCASTQTVSRNNSAELTFHQDAKLSVVPAEQAKALNAQARRIVQGSSLRGAAMGAAVGCGVGVIVGSSAKCLSHAALGAAGGALIGNASGKKSVAQRMRLAKSPDLARNIRAADTQLSVLTMALPDHLAAQDQALHYDRLAFQAGKISHAELDQRIDAIRKDRASLAEALSLTAKQSRQASKNLSVAASKGQTGLDWHINRTDDIAQSATSARSTISLL